MTEEDREQRRARLKARLAELAPKVPVAPPGGEPRYDEEWEQGVAWLDSLADTDKWPNPDGEL
jgi:hypothetical protein